MSCEKLNTDLSVVVLDYSPEGFVGSPTIRLEHGLQPGGLVSIVTRSNEWAEFNIKDTEGNWILHIVHRIDKHEFGLNTHINKTWGKEERITPVPIEKGVRTVTTAVYEAEGYRIFVNEKEIAFFKHRSDTKPHVLNIPWYCQVYKILYLTPKTIIP